MCVCVWFCVGGGGQTGSPTDKKQTLKCDSQFSVEESLPPKLISALRLSRSRVLCFISEGLSPFITSVLTWNSCYSAHGKKSAHPASHTDSSFPLGAFQMSPGSGFLQQEPEHNPHRLPTFLKFFSSLLHSPLGDSHTDSVNIVPLLQSSYCKSCVCSLSLLCALLHCFVLLCLCECKKVVPDCSLKSSRLCVLLEP